MGKQEKNIEEWLSVAEFCRQQKIRNKSYVYSLAVGKKNHMIKKQSRYVRVKLKPKMKENVHWKLINGKIKIHSSVRIDKGIVSGGTKLRSSKRKS